ncbi:hypothetical protein [Nioella sediminis]|uniref:hypothetical protein n=1 Tax=Nioella sediminis TaxID=1912092 RepID=UPI0008FD20B4|nr:hypothetical protein [Nioella sediminis]TBX27657.1 hypothetical protein TK43_10090 [Roseovarius sp. JS7-11]
MTIRALTLLALLMPLPALAQDEMQPLRVEVGDGAPMSYIGTRCAAFYASSAAYLGDQISEDMQDQVNNIVALLMMTAADAMEQEGMEPDAARDAVVSEVEALSDAYRQRFDANAEAGRNAFSDDPVYLADNGDCTAVMTGED